MLENLEKYDQNILQERQKLIDLGLTVGNNKSLKFSKSLVPKELSQFALSWSIGLVLSDATVQRKIAKTNKTCRLKIQQASYNKELLDGTLEILKPWVFDVSLLKGERNMYSLCTIQHEAFNILSDIFQNPNKELDLGACVDKIIPENINKYLDPVCVASWFCGDGGKNDPAGVGKSLSLNSQGFTKEWNERLAQGLRENFDWDVSVVYDYTNKKSQIFHYIRIEASSFDSFEYYIKPYIIDSFLRKVPQPRKLNSRFRKNFDQTKFMT